MGRVSREYSRWTNEVGIAEHLAEQIDLQSLQYKAVTWGGDSAYQLAVMLFVIDIRLLRLRIKPLTRVGTAGCAEVLNYVGVVQLGNTHLRPPFLLVCVLREHEPANSDASRQSWALRLVLPSVVCAWENSGRCSAKLYDECVILTSDKGD